MRLVRSLLIALCLVVAAAPRAGAAPRSPDYEAETEMLKAKQAMDRGQYGVAVGHLLVARSLVPEASGPYLHLGIAYERLGRCADAVPMLEEYLRRKPKSPNPKAAAALAVCRAATSSTSAAPATSAPETSSAHAPATNALAPAAHGDAGGSETPRPSAPPAAEAPSSLAAPPSTTSLFGTKPRAHLTIRIEPVGAHLRLNGQPAGTDVRQLDRELAPGSYELFAEHSGYESVARTGWLIPGEQRVDTLTLRKKRVWPIVVGVVTGLAVAGAGVAIVVTQVSANSPRAEVPFPMVTAQ